MAHMNYFRRNNLQILKLATYIKIDDHYSKCKLATFQIGKDCQMFIFYFVYPKHQVLLICNENKEISVANLMIQSRGGGTQMLFGRGCAADAAKPVPIFKGHFGGKGYPLLGVLRKRVPIIRGFYSRKLRFCVL